MPSIPSPARHAAALAMHNMATDTLGKGFLPGTIRKDGRDYDAEIWSLDAQLPALAPGALELKERLQFTISKKLLQTVFAQGVTVIYVQMSRAYVIDRVLDETSDATSWRFEARRAPGADPV